MIGFSYSPNQNNGNLAGQTTTVPGQGVFTQTYGYDRLNRLETVIETAGNGATGSWNASFGYGAFGNVWRASGSYSPDLGTPTQEQQYSSATNRLVQLSNGQSLPADTYDGAGNLQKEPWLTVAAAMSYDGENRLVSHTRGGTVVQYGYDGEGRRVRRVGPDGTTTYVYDAMGQLAAEYGPTVESGCGERCYVTVDHLGSTRMLVGTKGIRRYDYRPYGEELYAGDGGRTTEMGYTAGPDQVSVKFTGKERDAETGLDYFGARYFSGAQGRFTSPDPLLSSGRPWKPQSWNRYAYTLNNPLRFVDPNGLWEWDSKCKNGDTACEEIRQNFRDSVDQLRTALGQAKEGSKEYTAISGILDRIGTEGDKNNIRVAFSSKLDAFGETRPTLGGNIKMTFNFGLLEDRLAAGGYGAGDVGMARASLVGHEGTHASEGSGAGIKWLFSGQERANWEGRAINTESLFYRTINHYEPFGPLWNPSWLEADRDKIEPKRREAVESLTERLYGRKPKIQY